MTTPPTHREFPCTNCGAKLEFAPGTGSLVCSHCGTLNKIAVDEAIALPLLDYETYIRELPPDGAVHESILVRCSACGAETVLGRDVTSDRCRFCGSPVVAEGQSKKAIKPIAILPFIITKAAADKLFHRWIEGLWFAPGALARQAERSGIDGAYIPSWTYNADTTTQYSGERGDDYQETETYTEVVNGQTEIRTRTVTRTRWTSVRGVVMNQFGDLLVLATQSLPPKQAQKLEPWDLNHLVPYSDDYLSGMSCQTYQIDLAGGFVIAKEMMIPMIRQTIERDIGGDHQRIGSTATEYARVTFRHLLLPLWISAYKYNSRTFRFLVNARSGEIQGERPYSAGKIALLVAGILMVIAAIAFFVARSH